MLGMRSSSGMLLLRVKGERSGPCRGSCEKTPSPSDDRSLAIAAPVAASEEARADRMLEGMFRGGRRKAGRPCRSVKDSSRRASRDCGLDRSSSILTRPVRASRIMLPGPSLWLLMPALLATTEASVSESSSLLHAASPGGGSESSCSSPGGSSSMGWLLVSSMGWLLVFSAAPVCFIRVVFGERWMIGISRR